MSDDATDASGLRAIAAYEPKPGCTDTLLARLSAHEAALRDQGCLGTSATLRVRCDDGSVLEILEWTDDDSRVRAALSPTVRAAWQAVEDAAETIHRLEAV